VRYIAKGRPNMNWRCLEQLLRGQGPKVFLLYATPEKGVEIRKYISFWEPRTQEGAAWKRTSKNGGSESLPMADRMKSGHRGTVDGESHRTEGDGGANFWFKQ